MQLIDSDSKSSFIPNFFFNPVETDTERETDRQTNEQIETRTQFSGGDNDIC